MKFALNVYLFAPKGCFNKFQEETHNKLRRLRTGRPPTDCDDIRYRIIQFDLLMMNTTVLETCRGT
jgi:hypothetical protein